MGKRNKTLIIISVIILLAGISLTIYPWMDDDYMATFVIIGSAGLSYGVFNTQNIKPWKKILFTILATIGTSAIIFIIMAIISTIGQGSQAGFFTPG